MRRALVTASAATALILGSVTGNATAGTGIPLEPLTSGAAPVRAPGAGTGSAEALAALTFTLSGTPDPCMPIPLCIPPTLD
ncbi:hypothetical protein [Nocardia jinanensis]|uniref:Uncharacterized protein n=1 Tax=Nocardia jinanensis TaxID=382504 RepID=A0A917VZ80_9NOCA|nr:hypothetical protein [Nocardia jinanensis]GGL42659.1 hypothetical protein GCM10011588_66680 [Nocardia jinanensis]